MCLDRRPARRPVTRKDTNQNRASYENARCLTDTRSGTGRVAPHPHPGFHAFVVCQGLHLPASGRCPGVVPRFRRSSLRAIRGDHRLAHHQASGPASGVTYPAPPAGATPNRHGRTPPGILVHEGVGRLWKGRDWGLTHRGGAGVRTDSSRWCSENAATSTCWAAGSRVNRA